MAEIQGLDPRQTPPAAAGEHHFRTQAEVRADNEKYQAEQKAKEQAPLVAAVVAGLSGKPAADTQLHEGRLAVLEAQIEALAEHVGLKVKPGPEAPAAVNVAAMKAQAAGVEDAQGTLESSEALVGNGAGVQNDTGVQAGVSG